MPLFIDLQGRKFARLLVLHIHERKQPGRYFWKCLCDCGNVCVVAGMHLRSGNTTSCGCRKRETREELHRASLTHGLSYTRLYAKFHSMHERCSNPRHKDYHLYGGRGISVCARWERPRGVAAFVADMGEPPLGMTLDRINNDGNYEPRNCRWATATQQAVNKRGRRLVTWRNQTRSMTEWARLVGKPSSWLHKRLARLPLDQAMAPFGDVVEVRL